MKPVAVNSLLVRGHLNIAINHANQFRKMDGAWKM